MIRIGTQVAAQQAESHRHRKASQREMCPSGMISLFFAAAQCTVREAEAHIAAFKASLPAVGAWMERLVGRGGEDEWVATLGGRRRYFRNLKSGKEGEREQFCHPQQQRGTFFINGWNWLSIS